MTAFKIILSEYKISQWQDGCLVSAASTLPIRIIHYPPKVCKSNIFSFAWVLRSSQDKAKTMLMSAELFFFGGGGGEGVTLNILYDAMESGVFFLFPRKREYTFMRPNQHVITNQYVNLRYFYKCCLQLTSKIFRGI